MKNIYYILYIYIELSIVMGVNPLQNTLSATFLIYFLFVYLNYITYMPNNNVLF